MIQVSQIRRNYLLFFGKYFCAFFIIFRAHFLHYVKSDELFQRVCKKADAIRVPDAAL